MDHATIQQGETYAYEFDGAPLHAALVLNTRDSFAQYARNWLPQQARGKDGARLAIHGDIAAVRDHKALLTTLVGATDPVAVADAIPDDSGLRVGIFGPWNAISTWDDYERDQEEATARRAREAQASEHLDALIGRRGSIAELPALLERDIRANEWYVELRNGEPRLVYIVDADPTWGVLHNGHITQPLLFPAHGKLAVEVDLDDAHRLREALGNLRDGDHRNQVIKEGDPLPESTLLTWTVADPDAVVAGGWGYLNRYLPAMTTPPTRTVAQQSPGRSRYAQAPTQDTTELTRTRRGARLTLTAGPLHGGGTPTKTSINYAPDDLRALRDHLDAVLAEIDDTADDPSPTRDTKPGAPTE